MEEPALGRARHRLEAGLDGGERRPVLERPLPFPLLQHGQRAVVAEGVGVERGLDLEDPGPVVLDDLALAPVRAVQLGGVLVHERPGLAHGGHVVVGPHSGVARQAGGGALPAPVHRHQVDVHVDHEVRLGSPLVHLHRLAVVGGPEDHHPVGVLGVVVVQQAVGGERLVHPVAHGVAQLGLGHPPVQGQGGDDVDVVHAGLGRQVEHGLDDPLAHVGPLHGGQGQRQVVEGDRELHPRPEQGGQRIVVERFQQGPADGLVGVGQAGQWLGRVDHPAPAHRQAFQAEPLAVVEQDRRRRAVDVEDEAGAGPGAGRGAHWTAFFSDGRRVGVTCGSGAGRAGGRTAGPCRCRRGPWPSSRSASPA